MKHLKQFENNDIIDPFKEEDWNEVDNNKTPQEILTEVFRDSPYNPNFRYSIHYIIIAMERYAEQQINKVKNSEE